MIHQGNCLEWLAGFEAKSVDHVITDPPYEAEAHTKQRRVRRGEVRAVESIGFPAITEAERDSVASHVARVVRRWVLIFCQVEAAMLWRAACENAGLVYKRTCVWIKPDGQPQYTGDRPGMGYESIVVMHRAGRSRWNGGGSVGVYTHNKNSGGRHAHPTMKPEPLMLELIELFTDAGELVIDPFAGSGTTGVAALRRGRRFLGCEINAEYAARANERLQAEIEGSTIQAREAGQLALLGGRP